MRSRGVMRRRRGGAAAGAVGENQRWLKLCLSPPSPCPLLFFFFSSSASSSSLLCCLIQGASHSLSLSPSLSLVPSSPPHPSFLFHYLLLPLTIVIPIQHKRCTSGFDITKLCYSQSPLDITPVIVTVFYFESKLGHFRWLSPPSIASLTQHLRRQMERRQVPFVLGARLPGGEALRRQVLPPRPLHTPAPWGGQRETLQLNTMGWWLDSIRKPIP